MLIMQGVASWAGRHNVFMVAAPHASSPRLRMGVLVACGSATLAALAAAIVYSGLVSAGGRPLTPPVFVMATLLAVVVVGAGAILVSARTAYGRTAGWLAALAVSLAGDLVTVSAGFALGPGGGLPASLVIIAQASWWIVVLTTQALVAVVVRAELTGRPNLGRRWSAVIVGLALVSVVLGLGVLDPADAYPGLRAPLAGTLLASPAVQLVFALATVTWMLACLVPPVLLWRGGATTPRQGTGQTRERLTIAAIAASCPPLALLTCQLLALAAAHGLLAAELGETILSLVFCVPTMVFAAGVAAALLTAAEHTTATLRLAIRWVLSGLWFLVGFQLAVVAASLLAVRTGPGWLLAASAVAVVLTICFVAAYVPVARWALAFAASDSGPDDRLSDLLTAREREVLALLAEGQSNAAIASSLYLSERTIDSHVTAIFGKLGLDRSADANRRVQAAAAWLRASDAGGRPADAG